MPPLCDEKPCPLYSGWRRRVLRTFTRPTLLTGEMLHDDSSDDDTNDSDETISPDAERSEIRFTLERKQTSAKNSRNGDERGTGGRNSGGFYSGRNGNRGGRRNGNFRFQNKNSDNKNNDNNNSKTDGNSRGDGDRSGGGSGGRGGDDKNHGDGNDGDNCRRHGNGDGSGHDNVDHDNKKKGGNRGGNRNNGSGCDSSSSTSPSTSTILLPPPSPPPRTTSSTTPTTIITPISEAPTIIQAPAPSTIKDPAIPSIATPPPTLSEPSPIAEPLPISLAAPAVTSPIIAVDPGFMTSTSALLSGMPDSRAPVPTHVTTTDGQGDRWNDNNHHRGSNGKYNGSPNGTRGKGLDPAAERILIATGSLGIFILLCFICWIVYRTLKRSDRSDRRDTERSCLWVRCGRRSAKDRAQADNAPAPKAQEEPPSAHDIRDSNSMQNAGYSSQEKLYPILSEGVTYPSIEKFPNGVAMWQTAEPPGPQLRPNGQVMEASDISFTLQSQMTNTYYDGQPGLARQPSDPYDHNPARIQQKYRASEISSLSSGFGDGDLIVTQPNMVVVKPTMVDQEQSTETEARRGSWISRNESVGKRDSIYTVTTTASDRPARFRSIHSWVDQQKTRVKRAGSRAKTQGGEVPVVPTLP